MPTISEGKYQNRWSAPGSAERNCQPISDALSPLVSALGAESGRPLILELASGFGKQLAHVSSANPSADFQPTEADAYLTAQIDQTCAESGLSNVENAQVLDLLDERGWMNLAQKVAGRDSCTGEQGALFDGVFMANLLHISPFEVAKSIFAHLDPRVTYLTEKGEKRLLDVRHGFIGIYGAFNERGTFTSEGNQKFDADIRSRDPSYGLRDVDEAIIPLAERHGYVLAERKEMPAGNLWLAFRPRSE